MIWKWLYKTKSFLDKGTLCHLSNIVDRRNISATAADDFNACDDFFNTVIQCHVVTAAMHHFQMKNPDDMPVHPLLHSDLWLESKEKRKDALDNVTKEIALSCIDIFAHHNLEDDIEGDHVMRYAVEVLSQGLLYMEFSDSIREGDGDRTLHCWRYLMLVFEARRRTNYSIEALNLLAQCHFFMSQRQALQLIWSRGINVHGIPGHNIPCDLYMEHLNRICKEAVRTLASNKTPLVIQRAAKCVGVLDALLDEYDRDLCLRDISGKHTIASVEKDTRIIIKQLLDAEIFSYQEGRAHSCFEKVSINIISAIKHSDNFKKWMIEQLHLIRNTIVY